MKRARWTDRELALLRASYADSRSADIAQVLGRTVSQIYQAAGRLGLKKSAAYLSGQAAGRLQYRADVGSSSRFKPGLIPWNKGVKGLVGTQPGCRASQFKPGNRPHTWVPVGSIRVTKDGYLQRKVADDSGPGDWQSVHSLVWSGQHGAIPQGCVVVFKPGKKTTEVSAIVPDVLECLPRAELMRRNSYHQRYPPEVARLIQLKGAVNRALNRRLSAAAFESATS